MTITWTTFAIRLLVGFFLAMGIGIERQWLKTRGVLKTNVLVTLGSAMFVMLSIMTPGDASPTRISAQIVSGVGFLGGGVILREGASVRGINTAATLWCAAAIGTLVGSGFLIQAYVSTLAVVGANLLLRPLVEAFRHREDNSSGMFDNIDENDENTSNGSPFPEVLSHSSHSADNRRQYSCYFVCLPEVETKILKTIIEFARERQLTIVGIESKKLDIDLNSNFELVEIIVDFVSHSLSDVSNPEEIIALVKAETKVRAVSWRTSNY